MDKPSIERLFSACDVNKSGRIEYEEFKVVCQDMNVSENEIEALFSKFDTEKDGYIDFRNFTSRFQEVSEVLDVATFGPAISSQVLPWEEFVSRIDVSVSVVSESLRHQLADMYQAIVSSADTALLQLYEDVIHALINESMDHRLQCEQLENNLKRAEEMNTSQLAELEDHMEMQLGTVENRVRDEERQRLEGIMADMQKKHKNEIADLQETVDRLLKSHVETELNRSKEDMATLNRQIRELTQENEHLRSLLVKAQTNVSILHSDLDKLKNMYADLKAQHDRESEDLKRMVLEYQSYSSDIQILQEINKKLYDSNDGLRCALANETVATKRRLSPKNEIPARRMKPLRQSTLNYSCSVQHASNVHNSTVASWADRYLDSGVALPRDMAENTGSDVDCDESTDSVETFHHSYSYVPSDVEISDVKSEATLSVAASKASSLASSLRRRLSVFSRPSESDTVENEGTAPMYRLVLAGDAGAGKSSFLLRLTVNDFRGDIQTTLGVDFQIKKMLVDGEKTSLQIWDTAGQERFRSIAKSYFRKAHGVLLLYDVTSESSFLNVRDWVDQIQDCADDTIPMCVIGNKVDLREEYPEGSCVSAVHGEKLAKAYGALFCETSAKEGTNVVEAVLHLAREVKTNVKLRCQSESQIKLHPDSSKKTLNSCCRL